MSTVQTRTFTPEDLLRLPDSNGIELIDGELVEKPMSFMSSRVAIRLVERLGPYCSASGIGEVMGADLGYQCFPWAPKVVRKADVSMIRAGRITADIWEEGFATIAPDLAAEVTSPNELAYDVDRKVEEYLRAGVALVWVVNPQEHVVMVYRKDGSTSRLRDSDELDGEDVVPGFRCRVSELFPQVARPVT